ncbi:Chaoptin [Folsomia candida]|uniref:Chaoptin n=2 Tax=Folsomia candida TaxID=158441 RepID=A0A226EQB6_FOLCA|nr:Chaoptin [Folsomia candida]
MLDLDFVDRFDSDVLSNLLNLRKLSVETYPNIEKYRFRLGAVLSGIESLDELNVQIKESTLSDQLFGGILPGLRKLTVTGTNLRRIEEQAFEGLQNCLHTELTITRTSVEEIPARIFELLLNAEWAKLDLSFNKISTLNSASLYPNSSFWFSKGTKLLQGGLILTGNDMQCDCNLVWLGDWLRRWLRESYESHSVLIPEAHAMYDFISETTCLDSRSADTKISLVQLYPDHICHASALSSANSSLPKHLNFNTFVIIVLVLLLS